MRKLVATAAAGLMIAGGAIVSAPAASAYPAGADPAIAIVGSNTVKPRELSVIRAVNYTPGCRATMKITRKKVSGKQVAQRTRTISANTTANFAFAAPSRTGKYVVKVKQIKVPGCAGFSAKTKFRVAR